MKSVLIVFFVVGVLSFASAQSTFEEIDSRAKSVKANSIENLHAKLVKGLSTDQEKVRAFYVWITHTINYDINEASRSFRSPEKQEPEYVFRNHRAVCHGYASLFQELCNRSGIKCYLVSGFSKLNGTLDETGHTWNIIFIDGKWQPVDATWGAGGVNAQRKYVKQFSDRYFLTSPERFLDEHYPFDPMWQLMEYPVKLKEYSRKSIMNDTNGDGAVFNFKDTISDWEGKADPQKVLSSAQRMNRFNPGNKILDQELAFAFFQNGNHEFEMGNTIMAELYPKNAQHASSTQVIKKGSELFALKLDSIETYYKAAEIFYKQTKLTNAAENQVLQSNLKSLKNNLAIVRREKSAIRK